MKKILPFAVFLFLTSIHSQELSESRLDSLYNILISDQQIKCGFGLVNQIKNHFDEFSSDKQETLKQLLQRPLRDTSIVSPSGFFRIHYNVTGSEVPRYNTSLTTEENVMQAVFALDSSYYFEVNFLGYPQPPSDNGAGGDSKYDVYISNLGGFYGYTEFETHIGNNRYTSFMVIDNDYSGFFSSGLGGMRVTVAHELHHGIQVGNYIFRVNDIWFYEICSTAMEEFVYNSVNDYYAYLPDYFNNPERSFPLNNGYNLVIWNIYLNEKFGFDILKYQWELMVNHPALEAINLSLDAVQSDFAGEFITFGKWTYFTNIRAIPGEYFPEAGAYPLIHLNTFIFNPPSQLFMINSHPAANNFLKLDLPDSSILSVIISNNNYQQAMNNPNAFFSSEYELFNNPDSGYRFINDFYSADFNAPDTGYWNVIEIMNDMVVNVKNISRVNAYTLEQNYPNPFNPVSTIRYKIPEPGLVLLTVYDILGNKIAELVNEEKSDGEYEILFEGKNLSSGIYFYKLRTENFSSVKKMILLR